MEASAGSSVMTILITVVFTIVGIVALYYFYNFVYKSTPVKPTVLVPRDIQATSPPTNVPAISPMYEGGDYSVSFWVYVNSYNINRNRRKHILELAGTNFSSLLIGLGAFKNTLIVRTHSRDSEVAFVSVDAYGAQTPSSAPVTCTSSTASSTSTPNSQEPARQDGSLTKTDLDALFAPLALDDSLLDVSPICDLPEIDMQRWTLVSVVLSGRVIDVYVDGKLSRSCVTKSYYKVDPTGIKAKLLDRGGFDGHISNVLTYNYAISPSDIYTLYSKGPFGTSGAIGSLFGNLFGRS